MELTAPEPSFERRKQIRIAARRQRAADRAADQDLAFIREDR